MNLKSKIKKLVYFFYGLWNLIKFQIFEIRKIKQAEIVCFFPYYQTGGAEKVHLNIVKALAPKNVCVIFTLNSATSNFRAQFYNNAHCIEINPILNKRNAFVSSCLKKGIYNAINTSKKCKTVFGCNATYFYQILPFISDKITRIDLFHAFSTPDSRELEVINSITYIDKRVVITANTKKDLLAIYNNNGINEKHHKAILILQNGIAITNQIFVPKEYSTIKIGFVGRWSDEKRPELFLEIAKRMQSLPYDVAFYMVGIGMKSNIGIISDAGVTFLGEITNETELNIFYQQLSFLLITSVYEGFPMVIMESMAQGVISISTNVGGIREHITSGVNGILIDAETNEAIVADFVNAIEQLVKNNEKRQVISKNAFQYAQNVFDLNSFNENYKKLFELENNNYS